MNQKQKAIYQQLQLAGLGIVIFIVGLLVKEKSLVWIGLAVFAYGLVRTVFIYKVIQKAEKD